ncbi:hypothetical protein JY97_14930 [Alkalispirochaeta odontotermitis]|nr:hypothetical protein JY97_14930 [Alkalispirochaeta odontotermitis]
MFEKKLLLTDNRLQVADGVFKSAGTHNRRQVNAAVYQKQIKNLQADGLVDNAFLHFQRYNPDQYRYNGDQQQ